MNIAELPVVEKIDPAAVWADPIPLPSSLLPVPAFDEEMLPTDFRSAAVDAAERLNCPLDFVAIPMMVGAGSLIGRRVTIRPQQNTPWTEGGNLWGCIVGTPGSMKSPAASEGLFALKKLEAEAAKEYDAALKEYDLAQQVYEIEQKQARREAQAAMSNDESDLEYRRLAAREAFRNSRPPEPPVQKRFIANDSTPEKLGELCRDNPDGLLMHRDELVTMFTEYDQEEKAAGRGFLMSGWTGLDGYTFDRVSRGTVRIPNVNLSLFGTTQPNRLMSYMRDALRQRDDGFMQRQQLLAWPDPVSGWVNHDRRPHVGARERAEGGFRKLAAISAEKIGAECHSGQSAPFLRFVAEVDDDFVRWRKKLETKICDPDTDSALSAHLAKYRGLIPRLALICHLSSGGYGSVSVEAWVMATQWCHYLEAHARRAYAAVENACTGTAERIVAKIKKGDLPTIFTCRDIHRKGWSGLKNSKDVGRALKLLEEHDWLGCERVFTGGKPKECYSVNPKISSYLIH